MKLSDDSQISLSVAMTEAARLRHEYAGLEHLLRALVLDPTAAKILRHAGAETARLSTRLAEYLETEIEPLPVGAEDPTTLGEPKASLAFQRVVTDAALQVESSGRDEVQVSDLLVALFKERDSPAVQILASEGVSRLDVVSYLAHGVSRLGGLTVGRGRERVEAGQDPEAEETLPDGDKALAAYTVELTELARQGKIDPLIGRAAEIQRTLHILRRRRKNNPIFVGDPGVGKTALAEGLALKIARDEVPEAFDGARLYRLDLGALIAGTRYRGDFENRVKAVLAALRERAQAGGTAGTTTGNTAGNTASNTASEQPILFIDEIHTVVGAGSAGSGTMDASNLLKPALADGWLRVIGATTWEEFRQSFQRDAALARRFQKIDIREPSVDETVEILAGLKEHYETHHGVTFTRPALRAAAELAERYLRDRKLPDKAIDLLDEAGAAATLRGAQRVGAPEIEKVLATMAQIPARRIRGGDRERLAQLEEKLQSHVFGQREPIERLVAAIKVARAGLREADKPVGSFLLTGPTGVGKTETAKRLAEVLGISFLRFDMSEYREQHTVSRLVGAPPGYVGFDRGGLLTEAVAKNPHAVLLLDEVEKAHPDVFALLLQVMDHGTLTDTNGKQVDFRHIILLMTSNAGAREMEGRQPGFGEATEAVEARRQDSDRAIERLFTPEFRNRLDARLRFNPLSPAVMSRIVDKMLKELSALLLEKKVLLEVSAPAKALLAQQGYNPAFGARPLARVIDEQIKRPLTEAILFGELQKGGKAVVEVVGGEGGEGFELRFES